MTLATLAEAIEWARDHWAEQRPVPTRLHTRETEGVGLFYAHPFQAALDGSPDAVTSMPQTQPCYHPTLMARMSPRDCPECLGLGVKETRVDRFVYPMSRALTRLHNSLGPSRQPHPYHLLILLAGSGWNPRMVAADTGIGWDRMEALLLMSIRRLHAFYAAGPISMRTSASPTWIEKSESQQAAETAA
jgi:hypothetical protein